MTVIIFFMLFEGEREVIERAEDDESRAYFDRVHYEQQQQQQRGKGRDKVCF